MKPYENYVKLLSYGPCIALIGSLLIGSPQCLAQDAESSPSEPMRLTVAPHSSSRIAMKTLPKAVCVLHGDGDSDTSHPFKLFSDDDGMIRFNVNPSQEADEVAGFAVDCTADGQSRTFELELRPSSTPSLDMPAPAAEIRTTKTTDIIRPALTKAEALQLSDEELAMRQYPLRPNPEGAPAAFAEWLEMVTHPARRVDARQAAHTELRAGTEASGTGWSGFDLENAPNEHPVSSYDMVQGFWYVPQVTNPILDQTTYSVLWVGLDGDNNICPNYCPAKGKYSDLWQAGTGQQITSSIAFYWKGIPIYFTFSYYFAWTELIPGQNIEVVPNVNVSPGDLMYVAAWVGNPNQAASLSGADGMAYFEDLTQSEFTPVSTPRGKVNILGYQAEWIMERPYENNGLPDLADYGYAYMYEPNAQQVDGAWISYDQNNSVQILMYEDPNATGDLLSAAFSEGPDTIYYVWYNSN